VVNGASLCLVKNIPINAIVIKHRGKTLVRLFFTRETKAKIGKIQNIDAIVLRWNHTIFDPLQNGCVKVSAADVFQNALPNNDLPNTPFPLNKCPNVYGKNQYILPSNKIENSIIPRYNFSIILTLCDLTKIVE
jgi:hypothetical protein